MFLKPDYNIKCVYDIPVEELAKSGIKAFLFDLDSTLMASKSGCYTEKTLEFINEIKEKFFMAVVSNNKNKVYIDKVTSISTFPVLFDAGKPRISKVRNFLEENNLNVNECVLVGDRPLTDIMCGKLLGCKTVLVDSITAEIEKPIVRFVRFLERLTIIK